MFSTTALLIDKEPANLQAQSLGTLIDQSVARGSHSHVPLYASGLTPFFTEGYIGMALAGGAAAIGTLLIAGLIRRATKRPQ